MWRPRIYKGQVSLRRQENLFVIICRNKKEADALQEAIIKSLSKSRGEREKVLAKIKGRIRERLDRKEEALRGGEGKTP